jgi:hypothetical protein
MLLLVLASLATVTPPVEVETEHYEIRAAGVDALETGQMLDQLYEQMTQFFGHRPKGSLPIEIFPGREEFHRSLTDDGHPAGRGGGYYAPENRKVYVSAQPSTYYTRQLLLHEAVHQFHFLVATGNRKLSATWYMEGLAEYFAMHDWDGTRLRCGVVPAVSLEDYPAAALAEIERSSARAEWFRRVIGGDEPASRPLSWALAHLLMHRDRDAFRRLGERLDRDDDSLTAFGETIGPVTPEFADELHRWVAQHQQPWSVVWNQWQQSGDRLEGWAERTVGLIVHKEPLNRLQATIDPVKGPWKAGGVFGFQNENDFYLLQVTSEGQVQIIQRTNSGWQYVLETDLPTDARRFSVQRRGEQVRVTVNGRSVHEQAVPGKLGLHIDACRVTFRVEVDVVTSVPASEP